MSARSAALLMLLIGLALVVLAGGPDVAALLRYDRAAVDAGQWWRLLTAHFVHLSNVHLLLNAAALVLLAWWWPQPLLERRRLLHITLLALGVGMGLHLLAPHVERYVGLSGVLYGLFVLGLGHAAVRRDRVAMAVLVLMGGRIAWELTHGAPPAEARLIGGAVIVHAHLFGALAGALLGICTDAFRRPRSTG